jgi:7,8-dihydropterin-6-yl-methyl-4-(beta-D-ribofuranosyl)aminobenzene 5'-phosphate synthase
LTDIPRKNSFEKGFYKDDPMLNDSALAIKTSQGLVIVSGCAHAGICNICDYASSMLKTDIYAILGGFHLSSDDEETVIRTTEYLSNHKIEKLFPMHCIDLHALIMLSKRLSIQKLAVGDQLCFK